VVLICIAGRESGQGGTQHNVRWNSSARDWLGRQYDYPFPGARPGGGMKRIVFDNPRGNIKGHRRTPQEVTSTATN